MKLEDQVCSLDLAARLKELGVKQESLFYWKRQISAFTVAELGMLIPFGYESHRDFKDRWYCVEEENIDNMVLGNTEADARARMLIYLIEQKLVKP